MRVGVYMRDVRTPTLSAAAALAGREREVVKIGLGTIGHDTAPAGVDLSTETDFTAGVAVTRP